MSMSKKHFEALAAAVRCSLIDYPQGAPQPSPTAVLEAVAGRLATVCASFNPNFDRTRFLKACGVEEVK